MFNILTSNGNRNVCRMKLLFIGDLSSNISWVERGCTADLDDIITGSGVETLLCMDEGCNYKNVIYSNCIQCAGGMNSECAKLNDIDKFKLQCSQDHTYKKRGCFTMVKSE